MGMTIPDKIPLAVRVTPKMLAALRAEAEAQQRPMSELIREAIQVYLESRKEH